MDLIIKLLASLFAIIFVAIYTIIYGLLVLVSMALPVAFVLFLCFIIYRLF